MSVIKYIYILLISFCICLFSCKIGHKYERPEIPSMPEAFENQGLKAGVAADIGWGTLYSDTILQALISKALENNKDMKIAIARVKEMRAKKRISFSGIFPEIGLEIAEQRKYLDYGGKNDKYDPEIKANLNLSWELDIWGNLRWANDAGIAAYLQTVEAQHALQLSLVADVVQNYFELNALERRLKIVKQTLEARQEGAHFAKIRYEGGLTSEIPYRQSLVELARTETLIPSLENSIKLKENDLAVLIGEFPSTIIPKGKDISLLQIPEDLPIDLPSSILKRRPDVLKAEQQLIEANAQVGIAYTDMFPTLKITGRVGGENSELTDFLKSPAWFISGAFTGPIFNMGKNKAKHKAAKAVYEQALYNYEKTILEVFKEVNGAINTFRKIREVRISYEKLYNSAKAYYDLARLQYVNGIVNYIDVLDSQRQLFDAETALNDAILNELSSVVYLYKALGGGLIR